MIKKIKARSLLIGGIFTLLFVVLIVKIYWIQVVDASWLLNRAEQVWETDKILTPVRGSIVDRNDKVLAVDAAAYTVSLNPKIIDADRNAEAIVQGLTDILLEPGGNRSELVDKLRDRATRKKDDGDFAVNVEIRNEGWKIDKEKADKVRELIASIQDQFKLKGNVGIALSEDKKRYYPGETLAAHLLGYSNKEGQPALGLELRLDDYLKGVPGKMNYETDAKGVELPDSKVDFVPAQDGNNVRLTIDKNIQFYIESALAKAYDKWHPKSLMAIAVDPMTMEVLGMANMPNFNPNKYWETGDQGNFLNRAVASQYEPGSTFKIVTLTGAVQENLFKPNDLYQSGSIKVPGRTLHDHNFVGWGRITFLEGLKRSSNVAFVKLGYEMLGNDKLRSYIDKFGFGAKTNIDIAGEVPGIIDMKYPAEYATATYGQGKVVVTAIQQTAAYAAIANGGKLMWPHVVKDILDPKTGQVVQSFPPQVVRQIVPASTAKQVTEYLEQVVADQEIGTGKKAYIEGYRVAGKTGTANIVIDPKKGYAPDQWVVSFIGYAPAENPRILVTLIADQPDLGGNYHLGGDVVAPAFKEIVSQSLQYMGVPSSEQKTVLMSAPSSKLTVPDLTGKGTDEAKNIAKIAELNLDFIGKGPKVIAQFPKPGTQVTASQHIYVAMQDVAALDMPNMSGKSLRDALEVCSFLRVTCQSSGEGYVTQMNVSGDGADRMVQLQLHPLSEAVEMDPADSAAKGGGADGAGKDKKNE
ncbi:PASTA domain-containing protein [Paenibacillus athensensis]|uniref:Peptidoglycan glycosyltransferase n=1 Tax=Paenibacillus athensensis TaxID=1967502 RepID=A0A4Y8PWG6_9BACL|nr:penicillin-binding transpeptidase domain-containing protein [Paenibacillus athensensis]MCD1261610.1 PASTA domain-containing protein [Paenibacillus athensensis]